MAASLELLIDRLLSASTPTDCLDSLEQLQSQCKYIKPKSTSSNTSNTSNDPKKSCASQKEQQDNEASAALKLAEENEIQRQSTAIDIVISNKLVLNVLCSLVATSTLPSQHDSNNGNSGDGMEVEGGDIAACELLLALLPTTPTQLTASNKKNGSAVTTEGLQKQRNQKKRSEYISKTLLHFHESTDDNNLDTDTTNKDKLALVPSLLDCLCASTAQSTTNVPSVYARVLTLQILSSLLVASPGTLREQLMMAPDGINRLVDLLGHSSMSVDQSGSNSEAPEEVRNESILFLTSLASSSSMLARLITFSEGYDRALKIATIESTSSSFSIGSTTVMDCLQLCLSLAQADEVSRELFIGGGDGIGNLNRLCKLIDLRVGERFKDKDRNVWWDNKLKDEQLKKKNESSRGTVANEEKKLPPKEQGSTSRKGKRGKKSKQDDDLDDILKGASSTKTSTPAIPSKTTDVKQEIQPNKPTTEPEGPPTPYLTPNETQIVTSVFNLILILLQDGDDDSTTTQRSSITDASRTKRRARAKTIISHDLTRYIVDCALYTLPPVGVDYVSAVPSSKLQLLALVVMSVLGSLGGTVFSEEEVAKKKKSDTTTDKSDGTAASDLRKKQTDEESKLQTQLLFETMPIYLHGKVTAIDRLMYLCCTGGYAPNSSVDDYESSPEEVASLLSTYSVSTFRSCLPSETASRMVLHALAPPLPDETDEMGAPLQPPVVSRLVTTMADNLQFLQSQQTNVEEEKEVDMAEINRATISAAGSAGALGVFLTCGEGDATREMLLRLSPPPPPRPMEGDDNDTTTTESSSANLIDFILQNIATYDPASSSNDDQLNTSSAYITMSLLRLLSEWVIGMPRAVTEVLSSPASVSMGVLVRSKKGNSPTAEVVPAMSGLLLGLCLEYMEDSSTSSAGDVTSTDVENAAWTRDTVMNMIQSIGVGKYLSMLDEWKKRPLPLPYCSSEERSSLERHAFASWYGNNVTLVRRRVVVALAGSKGDDDSDESDAEATVGKPSLRSLRKMVSSQAQENEELQNKLEEALSTIASQSTQIEGLKRVTEAVSSADTNDMISEYTEKIAELEKAKAELKKEAENQTKLQEEAIASKDSEIDAARKQLEGSQARVEELRRDNETMSEEMAGLSSAYNSLEEQYHRSNSGSDNIPTTSTTTSTEMTAGGEAAAEDGGARSGEPAAEDPSRNNHHEIQSLREDNARLREEGRAANEWMSMAVSKMEEMSTENANLTTSLEEARTTLATAESNTTPNESVSAIQSELDALRLETQRFREESEVKLKAKDDEYAQQQVRVQQLEQQVVEMKQSSSEKIVDSLSPTSQEVEELKQAMNRQEEELTSLRQANKDAQEWMANAVTHVDQLTKDVQEKDHQIEQMAKTQSQTSSEDETSNVSPAIIVGLEKNLSNVTSERDELKLQLETVTNEVSDLLASNEDLKKKLDGDSQVQSSSEQDNALRVELGKVKAENTTLTTNLSEFQSWSTTAQERMAELESNIQEITADRDELKSQIETITSERDELKSQPEPTTAVAPERSELPSDSTNQQVESLQSEIRSLNEQLERMQDQLIEDADENEAKVDKLMEDLQAERQRIADMKVEEQSLSATIESLTSEKDKLTSALAEAQAEKLIEHKGDASVDDRIMAMTAERNELQSQLNDTNEEYKEAQSSVERLGVENGNLTARIRALEQDNKSLEYQFSELEGKITIANDEKAAVESSLEELKTSNEDMVRFLQERTQALENQIETQETEATEAIAQWEARCSSLEGSGESVIKQWEEKVESLEADINALQSQLKQQELDAAEAITQWEARCSSLEDSGGDVIRQWEERVQALESDITTLESQLEQQEKEASEAITQWESRCSALEDSGGDVIQQWEERVKTLESDITMLQDQLEQQEKQAAEAITQWEARCLSVEEDGGAVIQQWEERVHALESDITTLREQSQQQSNTIESLQLQIKEKDVEIFNSDEQVSELSKELLDAGYQSEVVVKQWQERCEQLQASINEYEEAMEEIKTGSEETVQLWQERTQELESQIETQEKEATEAITQWEARCTILNEQVENLEQQVLANENDTVIPELKDEVESLILQLQASKSDSEKIQEQLNDAKASLAQRISEWKEKKTTLTSTIEQLNNKYSEQQKEFSEGMASVNSLKERCSTLQEQNTTLQEQYTNALKESEESQVVVIELQEELRTVKEELQAFATDQFTAKATEMATQALREQMGEIRSQYTVDQQTLASESEARRVAEEEVDRLKSDLALLAQATEYNDDVDVHIRRIAKKMTADNIKTERKEIDELRSTLERLREELGSCRWKERESEEKAANARLQMSILEQEVIAAKTDLAMCQQAMEDVETSKIDASVSLEYRVEALENERRLAEQSYEEEIYNIKEELASTNQDRDEMAHKLQQSEKANAALVYSTTKQHESLGSEDNESEVIKLQLERAQLLAKINEMGVDLERRVREAVAAQSSKAEAERIIENQSRKSVESSLADALSELKETKKKLQECSSESKASELADKVQTVQDLEESLDDIRLTNEELQIEVKTLRAKFDTTVKENETTIDELKAKLQNTEERLRIEEREKRFETAIYNEIANLKKDNGNNQRHSQALVLRGIDLNMQPSDEGKESTDNNNTFDRNSAYIIEMYDYVVELKTSITDERQMYKELLTEHEDLLALLGQAGLNGMTFD